MAKRNSFQGKTRVGSSSDEHGESFTEEIGGPETVARRTSAEKEKRRSSFLFRISPKVTAKKKSASSKPDAPVTEQSSQSGSPAAAPKRPSAEKRAALMLKMGSMFKLGAPSLVKLVEEKDWEAVMERLETPAGQAQARKFDFMGYTILYDVCRKKPPLNVVKAVIEAFPKALKILDLCDRLPLHVACGTGASVEVIELLVNAYPKAVKKGDNKGRLPLHFAVEYGCSGRITGTSGDYVMPKHEEEEESSRDTDPDCIAIIKVLTSISSSIIHMKDCRREGASDIAERIGGSISREIIIALREVEAQETRRWCNDEDENDEEGD